MDRLFRIDFYPQDWLIDTARLDPAERGIFIQIVCLIYTNRGPIENNPKWIAGVCGCSSRLVSSVIKRLDEMNFVQVSGEKIGQKRAENELNLKRTHLELSSKGGRTKAENERENINNKHLNSTDTPFSVATSSPTPSPTATVEDKSSTPGVRKTPLKSDPVPAQDFEQFWSSWKPFDMDKGSKVEALKSYTKARKETDHETLIRQSADYCQSAAHGQRKTKHASTWLNQQGWKDEHNHSASNPRMEARSGNRPKQSYTASLFDNSEQAIQILRDRDDGR